MNSIKIKFGTDRSSLLCATLWNDPDHMNMFLLFIQGVMCLTLETRPCGTKKVSSTKSKSDLTLRSCPRWTLGVVQLKYQVYVLWAILASLWVLKIAAESCFLVGNMSERFDSRATGSHQVSDFTSMSLVRRKKDNWCMKNSVLWCLVTEL